MWRDHPFSQRNMAIERAVGVGVGGDREVGEMVGRCTKFEKRDRGRQYRGFFIK